MQHELKLDLEEYWAVNTGIIVSTDKKIYYLSDDNTIHQWLIIPRRTVWFHRASYSSLLVPLQD